MSAGRAERSRPDAGAAQGASPPSEDELRAAYEAELSRLTSADVLLQAAVSLLNLGARRLGAPAAGEAGAPAGERRDLEQVRDAIDGVRALLDVLERRLSGELGPLRDALSQLQLAYAREAQAGATGAQAAAGAPQAGPSEEQSAARQTEEQGPQGPGPAEASGRLWVPDR
jgi:hypothetical protein